MYAVIYAYISVAGDVPDEIKIMSKHRTKEAAIKAMLRKIPNYYGWDNSSDFYSTCPYLEEQIKKNGWYRRDEELFATTDSVEYWKVLEI